MALNTGNGATAAFTTLAVTYSVTNINLGESTVEKLETSDLATETTKTYISSDLAEPQEVELTIQWDTLKAAPVAGTADTLTVTFPQGSGEQTAANLAGSGFFTSVGYPELVNDTVQQATVTFAYDGETGPTYTKAVATV